MDVFVCAMLANIGILMETVHITGSDQREYHACYYYLNI